MKGYILTILTVSIVGGIISSLIDSGNQLKKYVKYVVSLVCIVCLISPMASVIGNTANIKSNLTKYFDEIFVFDKIDATNSLIINSSEEKICDGIKKTLLDKYNFEEKEVFVTLEIDKTDIQAIKIEKINVILTGKASWHDVKSVEEYLEDIIGGNVSVKRK